MKKILPIFVRRPEKDSTDALRKSPLFSRPAAPTTGPSRGAPPAKELGSEGLYFANAHQLSSWLSLALGRPVVAKCSAKDILKMDAAGIKAAIKDIKDSELKACDLVERIRADKVCFVLLHSFYFSSANVV